MSDEMSDIDAEESDGNYKNKVLYTRDCDTTTQLISDATHYWQTSIRKGTWRINRINDHTRSSQDKGTNK